MVNNLILINYIFLTATNPNTENTESDNTLRVAVIILTVTTSLLVVALLMMCLFMAKRRLKRRNETYQIPYYSQPTISIPPLPQRNRRNNSTSSNNAISNDINEGQPNRPELIEINQQDSNEEIMIPAHLSRHSMLHCDVDVPPANQQNEEFGGTHITFDRNVAYGTNIAACPEIATEENIAYSTNILSNQA